MQIRWTTESDAPRSRHTHSLSIENRRVPFRERKRIGTLPIKSLYIFVSLHQNYIMPVMLMMCWCFCGEDEQTAARCQWRMADATIGRETDADPVESNEKVNRGWNGVNRTIELKRHEMRSALFFFWKQRRITWSIFDSIIVRLCQQTRPSFNDSMKIKGNKNIKNEKKKHSSEIEIDKIPNSQSRSEFPNPDKENLIKRFNWHKSALSSRSHTTQFEFEQINFDGALNSITDGGGASLGGRCRARHLSAPGATGQWKRGPPETPQLKTEWKIELNHFLN